MLRDVKKWLPPDSDPTEAETWLSTQTALFGEDLVRGAYAQLKTEIAGGKSHTSRTAVWASIAGRLSRELASPQRAACAPANGSGPQSRRTANDIELDRVMRELTGGTVQ